MSNDENDGDDEANGTNGTSGRTRKLTIGVKSLTKHKLRKGWDEVGGALTEDEFFEDQRPRTWGECREENDRPCPWIACKHHLYLDVDPDTGSIIFNFPDREPWEIQHTCSLDVAARGGMNLEEVGEVMNLTRERIRQIEIRALTRKMFPKLVGRGFDDDDV